MTRIRMLAAVFAIFVGVSILGMWLVFILTGQVPELSARPVETSLHLTAEFLTAVFLVGAGVGLLTGQKWGAPVFLVAMGMLLYSVIQAAGYFAQLGMLTFILMFAIFALLDVVFTVLILYDMGAFEIQPASRARRRVWRY